MSWRQWSILVLCFAAVSSVVGQKSDVTQCISTFNWSINSLQQTPCLVAAYLESACGEASDVPSIPAEPIGEHYLGPNASQANPCLCSSVTYSTISACAGCQNSTYIDWLTWSQDCTLVSLTIFPKPLPSAVVVPSWAYLNISLTNNNFSVAAAEQNASESSASSSTSTSVSNSLTPSTTAIVSHSSKSNAGAIAGGVVGGIAFVAIVGLGMIWFCWRRKRNMDQRNKIQVAFDSRATESTRGISPFLSQPSQSIYTSDMSIYPGNTTGGFTTIPPSRRSLESVSPSVALLGGNGGGSQTHANVPVIPRGYTGMPEI